VEWASPPDARRRLLGVWCVWLLLGTGAVSQPAQRPGQMPTLPLTQLDERAPSADLDRRAVTLTFPQPVPVRDLLMQLVRDTGLSMIPDASIGGAFIGELKNVTPRQALAIVLPPLGLDYTVDGGVIRVFRREPETRIFDINYLAAERAGASTVGAVPPNQSGAAVSTTAKSDVFADIANGVRALLSERAPFNIDRKAGLLQATDVPERLDRVAVYLDAVSDRVHRQAQIDARVVEVELEDENASGVDWPAIAAQLAGQTRPAAAAGAAPRRSVAALRVTDVDRLLSLLAAQGKVTVVASPRFLTLNNEPAIVRTDTVTLSVTPQISTDSVVTLSLSPIVKSPATAESDMLARVGDGETLVVSGFTRERETRERRNAGRAGGWFGRSTVVTRKRLELVVLLTPRIVAGLGAP
jgi:type II secretory pathway component GspD/PulD (secretin)